MIYYISFVPNKFTISQYNKIIIQQITNNKVIDIFFLTRIHYLAQI